MEGRDDADTVATAPDFESRTAAARGDHDAPGGPAAAEEEEGAGLVDRDDDDDVVAGGEEDGDEGRESEMNATRVDEDDEDDRLDIHSVLSGNTGAEEEDDEDEEDDDDAALGKNLGAIFDDAREMERHLKIPPGAAAASGTPASAAGRALPPRPASANQASRPPLAPPRPGAVGGPASGDVSGKRAATTPKAEGGDDRRLNVFLRVRPPVAGVGVRGAKGKGGGEGSMNTVEVLGPDEAAAERPVLPTTIRTYPPLNSNAAKVVRGGGSSLTTSNDAALKKTLGSSKSLVDDGNDGDIDPRAEVRGVKEYSYSGVFGPEAAQEQVYDNVAAPLVDGLFPKGHGEELGESALLFTLGVTNAGKTHTVMGSGFETKKKGKMTLSKKDDFDAAPNKDWGIIPRSLDHMLARVKCLNEQAAAAAGPDAPQLRLYMSYLEIYNEQIFDLLPDEKSAVASKRRAFEGPPTLKLRESSRGRIFVRGLARHAVADVRRGLDLARTAKNNRHTASNNINAESSRSHSICQLEVAYEHPAGGDRAAASAGAGGGRRKAGASDSGSDYPDSEYETDDESVCTRGSSRSFGRRSSKPQQTSPRKKSTIIWIVDLAGSERSKRTHSTTRHQKEAALINASLMNLMRCLREMLNHQPGKKRGGAPGGGVVPFRESKLTHMFMNHLTGPAASRTSMVVNVNPAADDYDETQHVLGYAATARSVAISAVDYNRKRRMFAKEGARRAAKKARLSPKKGTIARIAKKLSPKKRKGTVAATAGAANPRAKRLRSRSPAVGEKLAHRPSTASGALGRKPPPRHPSSARAARSRAPKGDGEELERLREEKFALQVTVDDLRLQLADSEAEVRSEVVEMMGAQLEERKASYEARIAQLQRQLADLQSSKQAGAERRIDEQELLNECEEEMKRMREEHEAEMEEMSAAHLHLVTEHEAATERLTKEHRQALRAERDRSKELEREVGALKHRTRELQAGHDGLLAKYNALLALEQRRAKAAAANQEKENPVAVEKAAALSGMQSPNSIRKLPRQRVSGVAAAADADVVTSPKKKMRSHWFKKAPGAKVAVGEGSPKKENSPKKLSPTKAPLAHSPARSPLGDINRG